VLSGTNGVTFPDSSLQAAAASPYVLKNRIINGDMRIDQRNNGASVSNSGATTFYLDRWNVAGTTSAGVFSIQQVADAPSGFTYSAKMTVTTADASLAASDRYVWMQRIEGYNVADLAFGTVSAKTITLSFWVKSSLTGTFGGAINNGDSTRSYLFNYTISTANTWEYKSVTIAGDTTGTWSTNNSRAMQLVFSLGVGSDYNGTLNSWSASGFFSTSGATNVLGTLSATWQITGVQLEQNTSATPFERRLYNQELANCQRYCVNYRSADSGSPYFRYGVGQCETTTLMEIVFPYPVPMRVLPTLTTTGTAANYGVYHSSVVTALSSVPTINNSSSYLNATINGVVASGLTQGRACALLSNNNNTSYLLFSAEL
jgi:hypothetical protein